MKHYLTILLVSLTCLLAGCSTTPNRASYIAVGTTTATVSASIKAFNFYIASHPLTHEQEVAYANALATYVNACELVRAAETAAQGAGTAPDAVYQSAATAGNALLTFMSNIAPLVVRQPSTPANQP